MIVCWPVLWHFMQSFLPPPHHHPMDSRTVAEIGRYPTRCTWHADVTNRVFGVLIFFNKWIGHGMWCYLRSFFFHNSLVPQKKPCDGFQMSLKLSVTWRYKKPQTEFHFIRIKLQNITTRFFLRRIQVYLFYRDDCVAVYRVERKAQY